MTETGNARGAEGLSAGPRRPAGGEDPMRRGRFKMPGRALKKFLLLLSRHRFHDPRSMRSCVDGHAHDCTSQVFASVFFSLFSKTGLSTCLLLDSAASIIRKTG